MNALGAPSASVRPGRIDASQQPEPPTSSTNPVFTRLLNERIILLGSEVRDDNANEICAALLLLAAQSPDRDISLYINSPGGSVTAGMAIYDTMQFVNCDITTVAMGMAASMGQFLLSAGTPGKRYALPHARIMMHQPSGGMGGSATDIKIQAEQMMLIKRQLAELTAKQTGQSVEQIEEDSDRDRWFTADQAQEYGLIDRVMTRSELHALATH
jgi:ATP-dependent Clp protease protease subunit